MLAEIVMPNFRVASSAALRFPTCAVLCPAWMYASQYFSNSSALSSGGSFFLDCGVAATSLAC